MDLNDRQQLVDDLIAALKREGISFEGGLLLELSRVERELAHSLAVVRRVIDIIVAAGLGG